MCLLPGMLQSMPSRPSPRAERLAIVLRTFVGVFFLLSALRLISLSIWSCVTDLLCGVYGVFVLRPFRKEPKLVVVENVACFGVYLSFNSVMGIFTLMELLLETQMLFDVLKRWQVDVGLAVSGVAIATYALAALCVYRLYGALRETPVTDEEQRPLFADSGGYFGGGRGVGLPSDFWHGAPRPQQPPTGVYASSYGGSYTYAASTTASGGRTEAAARFPGQGYTLGTNKSVV